MPKDVLPASYIIDDEVDEDCVSQEDELSDIELLNLVAQNEMSSEENVSLTLTQNMTRNAQTSTHNDQGSGLFYDYDITDEQLFNMTNTYESDPGNTEHILPYQHHPSSRRNYSLEYDGSFEDCDITDEQLLTLPGTYDPGVGNTYEHAQGGSPCEDNETFSDCDITDEQLLSLPRNESTGKLFQGISCHVRTSNECTDVDDPFLDCDVSDEQLQNLTKTKPSYTENNQWGDSLSCPKEFNPCSEDSAVFSDCDISDDQILQLDLSNSAENHSDKTA